MAENPTSSHPGAVVVKRLFLECLGSSTTELKSHLPLHTVFGMLWGILGS